MLLARGYDVRRGVEGDHDSPQRLTIGVLSAVLDEESKAKGKLIEEG